MAHLTLGYLTLDAPPLETVVAATDSGYSSVGIRITGRRLNDPYSQVIGNRTMIREIRLRVSDGGLRLSNVSAYHFFPDVTWDHLDRVLDTVAELGSKTIIANTYTLDESHFLDLFSRYCETAERLGIRIAVEFMRYSECKTIQDATRVVCAVGRPNVGYLIDPLHLERSGGSPADIAALEPARIVFVQLCDAQPRKGEPSIDELRQEARTGRLHPGEGGLPLYDFLDALPPETEIEVEVPRPETASLPHAQRAAIAKQRATVFLAEYRAARRGKTVWS